MFTVTEGIYTLYRYLRHILWFTLKSRMAHGYFVFEKQKDRENIIKLWFHYSFLSLERGRESTYHIIDMVPYHDSGQCIQNIRDGNDFRAGCLYQAKSSNKQNFSLI